MKAFALLAAISATAFSSCANPPTVQELWSHLFTNGPVIWQATNELPKSFWTYKKILPHIFSVTVITNAIVLASFESKGFPQPSTNDTCIFADPDCDSCGCARFCNFSINPGSAMLSFDSPYQNNLTQGMPSDSDIMAWALNNALELGVDPKQIAFKNFTSHYNRDTNDNKIFSQISGRGVFLSRQLDGISFYGNGDNIILEGFWIEFGGYGQIRAFNLIWPELKRVEKDKTASPQEIVGCIKGHKTIVIPDDDEPDYFARLKTLATARKLTITKITPYYSEGNFGEMPTNGPPEIVVPIVELEAIADFGNSNMLVRLYSPILASGVARLIRPNDK